MKQPVEPDTEELLDRVGRGDDDARGQLLARHRKRLRALIALRMDRRLAARVDPSDVVQESLVAANARLPAYLRERPLPLYLWLREVALERLVDLHRLHIRAQKRSVRREEGEVGQLSDESMERLVHRVVAPDSSPIARLQRKETAERVRAVIAQLGERDRDLLVLRHLEQLSVREIAAVMGLTEGAVKVRHVRALQQFRGVWSEEPSEGPS